MLIGISTVYWSSGVTGNFGAFCEIGCPGSTWNRADVGAVGAHGGRVECPLDDLAGAIVAVAHGAEGDIGGAGAIALGIDSECQDCHRGFRRHLAGAGVQDGGAGFAETLGRECDLRGGEWMAGSVGELRPVAGSRFAEAQAAFRR